MENSIIERPLSTIAASKDEWTIVKEQAAMLVNTGFLPKSIRTPEQAIAIMMKGKELGIPTMQALSQINIIDGRVALASELMMALIYKNCLGAKIEIEENTNENCIIFANRPGSKPTKFVWSMEDAQRAQLTHKDNWKKYPKAMLRNRCIAEMARSLFPDCISGGSYIPEEIEPEITVYKPMVEKYENATQCFSNQKLLETPQEKHLELRKQASELYLEITRYNYVNPNDMFGNIADMNTFQLTSVIEACRDYIKQQELKKTPEIVEEKSKRTRKTKAEMESVRTVPNKEDMEVKAEDVPFAPAPTDEDRQEPEWYIDHDGKKAYAMIEKMLDLEDIKPEVKKLLGDLWRKELMNMDHISLAQCFREAQNGKVNNLEQLIRSRKDRP